MQLSITTTSTTYEDYEFREGDVVYCDPPYQGTRAEYNKGFDHDKFWEWVRTRNYPVYVSEYNAPDDFISVFKKEKVKLGKGGNSAKNGKALEQIFIHRRFAQ